MPAGPVLITSEPSTKKFQARAKRLGFRCARALSHRSGRVPVLMYHRIHEEPDVLNISPERFAAQMRLLRECFSPISLSELVAHLHWGRPLPPDAVVVTFDDGYRDNYTHAFPILKAYDIPATFFVTTGMIGERRHFWWDRVRRGLKPVAEVTAVWPELGHRLQGRSHDEQVRLVCAALKTLDTATARERLERLCDPVVPDVRQTMTWEELREMAAEGMEIGSHTVTHPILANQDPEEAAWEIQHSKETLERELDRPVRHFAYPNGRMVDFSPTLMALIEGVGYQSACSTVTGYASLRSSRFALERIGVCGGESFRRFLIQVSGFQGA
ncbi:polysaccharide deacetylase family protein [bacterium]|nr:polysaccharide deacetylase family protein [bacterium]